MSPDISAFEIVEWKCLSVMRNFLAKPHEEFFSIVDAGKVVSLEQLKICHEKAMRITVASNKIRMPESAFLMLLSGNYQISRAQEEVGITSSTKSVLVVYESRKDFLELKELCGESIVESEKIPVPELDRDHDDLVFSRMAKVQLNL